MYLIFLFATLSSPVWGEREAASAALLHLVDRHPAIYGPRLAALAKDATEPEVRARVRIPLACYQRRMAELYVPTGVPVWPCHDMASAILEVRVPITGWCVVMSRRLRITSLPNGLAVCGPWWHRHRAWTENMARDMIREGTPAGEVDDLLQKMWQVEQQLQADCPLGWASESQHWRTWQGGYPTPRE